jgi:DtxR family Mn-dependent transcriptional regulator
MFMVSRIIEDYIETIYALEVKVGTAHTGDIATELDIKPASVTEMMQKLSDMQLVKYEPYHGVSLTSKGKRIAKELMQRHETLAKFLIILGVDEETAESDACQIEHHVTPKTMKRLTNFVEYIHSTSEEPKWLKEFLKSYRIKGTSKESK